MERVLYNTVLGAKPLQPDGHAFYYSDYHSSASKVYFPDAWPCCSGTLPQVAADYRILPYFRDAAGVFVNLYLPSTLRWTAPDGAQGTLSQTGDYPVEGNIEIRLRLSRPSQFALRLRIPAWALQARPSIRINAAPVSPPIRTGFATLQRRWKDGDRIDLTLALPLRLEPIDSLHPNTVALVRGPLVLFATARESSRHERTATPLRGSATRAGCVARGDRFRSPVVPAVFGDSWRALPNLPRPNLTGSLYFTRCSLNLYERLSKKPVFKAQRSTRISCGNVQIRWLVRPGLTAAATCCKEHWKCLF
jgi:hypothetical protein